MEVNKETLGSDGYVHCCECGEGFIGVHTCQKSIFVHLKYVQLILCQLCLNKKKITWFICFTLKKKKKEMEKKSLRAKGKHFGAIGTTSQFLTIL